MAWRYENPGYRELLTMPGHTVKCTAQQSKTGYAFWQNRQLPSFDIPESKELWVRFDIYIATESYYIFRASGSSDVNDGIYHPVFRTYWIVYAKGNEVGSMPSPSVGLHSCLLHMVSDETDGKIQIWMDDKSNAVIDYTGGVKGGFFDFFFLESDNKYSLCSNVIISDEQLSLDDNCDLSNTQWVQPVIGKNGTWGVDDFAVRRSDGNTSIYKIFDVSGYNIPLYPHTDFYIKENVSIKRIYVNYSISGTKNTYTHTLYQSDDGINFEKISSVQKAASDYYALFDLKDKPATKHYYRIEVSGSAGADGVTIDANVHVAPPSKDVIVNTDTRRNVSNAITQSSDTDRHLVESLSTQQDTARALTAFAVRYADTSRIISATLNASADTLRTVSRDMVINADTVRVIAENIDVDMAADTARNVYRVAHMLDDTTRKISNLDSVNADVQRTVSRDTIDMLDTVRTLTYAAGLAADTARDVSKSISVNADTARVMNNSTITLHADTSRQIANDASVSVDTMRDVSLTLALSVDLSRDTGKISFDADVVRDVYVSHIDVLEDTIRRMPYLIDNKMIQSITLTIEEHTISDKMDIKLVGANYMPKDSVRGKFLDYPYNMMILSTTQDKDGIVQSINAVNDFYKFNFCKTRYFVYDNTGKRLKSSQFVSRLAAMIGYQVSILIDDYEPEMKVNGNGYEYREDSYLAYGKELRYESYPQMLTSIFGWTQQLPWRQINVFAHDGVLYAIQRGKEPNIVDLTSRKITRPHIEQTLYSQDAEFYEFEYLVPGKSYISGHTGGERYQEFAHNLLNGSLDTQYDSYGNITHTVGKLNGDGGENLTAYTDYMHEYDAEGNILSTVTDVTVYNSQNEVVDRYSSGSVDAGNRNSAYMMTNGDTMIAGTTAGHPTNKPFADESFTWSTAPTAFYFCKVDAYGNRSKKFKLHDMPEKTFPIGNEKNLLDFCTGYDSSYGKIKSLFHELMAYNQKIQETLTFDIVDPISDGDMSNIHIIDMRDKIKLNGNIYYLERNVVTLTKKSLRQSLSIVRWF